MSATAPVTSSAIPCTIMRGGTSKGLFFRRSDLAADQDAMLHQLRCIVGAGSPRGVGGLGGLDPLANKIALVDRSSHPEADLDYAFVQVADLERGLLDQGCNCGNILTAVAPFALESELLSGLPEHATVRIRCVNTQALVHASLETANGRPVYDGAVAIDGVPGRGSPIELNFAPNARVAQRAMFPSGRRLETLNGIDYTYMHAAGTMFIVRAESFGKTGGESAAQLNADAELLDGLERFRREAARRHGLGDVKDRVVPKLALVSRGGDGAHCRSRYFTPRVCHPAHAVTGALTVAVAARLPGTIVHELARPGGAGTWWDDASASSRDRICIAHPAGVIEARVTLRDGPDHILLLRQSLIRTARKIMTGTVHLDPSHAHDD